MAFSLNTKGPVLLRRRKSLHIWIVLVKRHVHLNRGINTEKKSSWHAYYLQLKETHKYIVWNVNGSPDASSDEGLATGSQWCCIHIQDCFFSTVFVSSLVSFLVAQHEVWVRERDFNGSQSGFRSWSSHLPAQWILVNYFPNHGPTSLHVRQRTRQPLPHRVLARTTGYNL